MVNETLKILYTSAEVAPLAKVGGLADVAGSLPVALKSLGCDIRILMPRYGLIDSWNIPTVVPETEICSQGRVEKVALKASLLNSSVPVYLLENEKYFDRPSVYEAGFDLQRFFFFSQAIVELLPQLDWKPDIIHCQDWHTAIVPLLLKDKQISTTTILTIHNLAYQGRFDNAFFLTSGLCEIFARRQPADIEISDNLLGLGILHADAITTVSPTYAREILTPEYGEKLDDLLRRRQNVLSGILNGINDDEFNPEKDRLIAATFSSKNMDKKRENKVALQKRCHFREDGAIPVIGMVSRLDKQKGFDLLEEVVPQLFQDDRLQIIVLGTGWEYYVDLLKEFSNKYPGQFCLNSTFDNPLAHLIYAGADMFLMPSRFEPCGLGQMIALRYGTVPVVRRTGGLADTIRDVDEDKINGNGFVFNEYDAEALYTAVIRALDHYQNQKWWSGLIKRVMNQDFSWDASAKKYMELYKGVIQK